MLRPLLLRKAGGRYCRLVVKAFTFAEVLIVLILIGIIVLLAFPPLTSALTGARLSGAAAEVRIALESAQLRAVNTGRPCRVRIDAAADAILVEQIAYDGADFLGGDSELAAGAVEQETYTTMTHALKPDGFYRVDFAGEGRFGGVDIVTSAFPSVVFDALGRPSAGGAITLTCGQQQIVLELDDQSGKTTQSN